MLRLQIFGVLSQLQVKLQIVIKIILDMLFEGAKIMWQKLHTIHSLTVHYNASKIYFNFVHVSSKSLPYIFNFKQNHLTETDVINL